jgi:hypothetical protein
MNDAAVESANDAQAYKFGRVCGWVIFAVGSTIFFAGIAYAVKTGVGSELATFFAAMAVPGAGLILLLTGLGLVRRHRVGLWLLYIVTAVWLYGFCSTTTHRLISGTRDDIYGIIWAAIWMIAWLYVAGYFYRRRHQFAGSRRSHIPNPSEDGETKE